MRALMGRYRTSQCILDFCSRYQEQHAEIIACIDCLFLSERIIMYVSGALNFIEPWGADFILTLNYYWLLITAKNLAECWLTLKIDELDTFVCHRGMLKSTEKMWSNCYQFTLMVHPFDREKRRQKERKVGRNQGNQGNHSICQVTPESRFNRSKKARNKSICEVQRGIRRCFNPRQSWSVRFPHKCHHSYRAKHTFQHHHIPLKEKGISQNESNKGAKWLPRSTISLS